MEQEERHSEVRCNRRHGDRGLDGEACLAPCPGIRGLHPMVSSVSSGPEAEYVLDCHGHVGVVDAIRWHRLRQVKLAGKRGDEAEWDRCMAILDAV